MKGIFLRELRENAKWGVIVCLVFLFIVLRDIRYMTPLILYELAGKNLVLIAPIAGLLLGVVQSLFEMKSDNWAFAVHRPIARRTIFLAKCAAGLLVLYVSLAIPVTYAAWWASRPGHQASPFQARVFLPLTINILLAGCYYFAAMVLMLRKARWYGTRLMPLGLALACSGSIAILVPEFWQALVLVLFVQITGALAAWGTYSGNGAVEGHIPIRVALAIMIYPGALAVGLVMAGISETFIAGGGPWHYYQIDRQGNPIRTTLSMDNGQRHWTLADPSGQVLPQYDNIDLDDPANANLFVRLTARLYDESSLRWPTSAETGMTYQSPLPGSMALSPVAPPGMRLRFSASYNLERRLIELYDPITRELLGNVSPGGFSPAGTPLSDTFPDRLLSPSAQRGRRTLPFPSVVYWIELNQRRVVPIFTAPPNDAVISAGDVGPADKPSILVATRHRLWLLRPTGETVFSAPFEMDAQKDYLQAALLAGGGLVIQISSIPGFPRDLTLLEFAQDGTLAHRITLPKLPELRGPKPLETVMFGAMFPLAARPLCPKWVLDEVIDIRAEAYAGLFESAVISSAILAALLTGLLAWRYSIGPTRAFAWGFAGLLVGLPIIGVFLGLHKKPAGEKCPACGARRLADRRLCPQCAAPLPPPPLDGSEIFEPEDGPGALIELPI